MKIKAIHAEAAAVLAVLLVLGGLPLLLWYWNTVFVPGQYPPGSKIIHLTAVAKGGVWTQDPVVGYAYWWKKPARTSEIRLTKGDHVVLFLHSPDVQHSFSIPDLQLGPVAIPAGHTVEVQFDADRVGELHFMCTQVCGRDHSHLEGRFIVRERSAVTNTATVGQGVI
jgi:heme/copper-type cytochrome/quinol oxidase subunit 2